MYADISAFESLQNNAHSQMSYYGAAFNAALPVPASLPEMPEPNRKLAWLDLPPTEPTEKLVQLQRDRTENISEYMDYTNHDLRKLNDWLRIQLRISYNQNDTDAYDYWEEVADQVHEAFSRKK